MGSLVSCVPPDSYAWLRSVCLSKHLGLFVARQVQHARRTRPVFEVPVSQHLHSVLVVKAESLVRTGSPAMATSVSCPLTPVVRVEDHVATVSCVTKVYVLLLVFPSGAAKVRTRRAQPGSCALRISVLWILSRIHALEQGVSQGSSVCSQCALISSMTLSIAAARTLHVLQTASVGPELVRLLLSPPAALRNAKGQ